MPDRETLDQCRRLIAACDREQGWALDSAALERYVAAVAPLLEGLPAERWPAAAANFHADHATVAALRDAGSPGHARAWERWSSQALGFLRSAGLDWSSDGAVGAEDMVQIALAALAQALPSYRYHSRFSSWAYSVVVRSAQRQLRAARAQRRSAAVASLEAVEEGALPAGPADAQEQAARASLLAERVRLVLAAHPDRRLAAIFHLWAAEERTSAEIGALVGLHESRVRALLKLARELLRASPEIRAWLDSDGG